MAQGKFRPFRWIIVTIFLGTLTGMIWAAYETGKLQQWLRTAKEVAEKKLEEAQKPEPPKPKEEAKEQPKPAQVKKDTSQPPPKKVEPAQMTQQQFKDLLTMIDRTIKRGELDAARAELAKTDRSRIPDGLTNEWNAVNARLKLYFALVAETNMGRLSQPPKVYELLLDTGGQMIVKISTSDDKYIYFETLTGIGSSIETSRLKAPPKELTSGQAVARMEETLISKCKSRNIIVDEVDYLITGFRDSPSRPAAAISFFDMADYCVEHGLNDKAVMLLDEAIKRDQDIVRTVHEEKAKRLLDLLWFSIQIKATDDARETFEKLNSKYSDTVAFAMNRDKLKQHYGPAVKEGPVARADPRPAESRKDPEPTQTPTEAPKTEPTETSSAPTSTSGAPDEIQAKIRLGDEHFAKGKKHLSDYNNNPNDGQAVRHALKEFTAAFQAYDEAQNMYERLGMRIPQDLLDKVRETNMIRSMCRKLAVSK